MTATGCETAFSTTLSLNAIGTVQGTTGQAFTFTAASVNGTTAPYDTTYTWSFGDGSTATGQTVEHTFGTAGTFTVTVTASSASTGETGVTSGTAVITAAATSTAPVTAGPTVTYQPGWNLVGGPTGTVFSQADGPLYTMTAGGTTYTTLPNTSGVTGGDGYWAYFASATTVELSGTGTAMPNTVRLPAGQFVMIGNPSATQTVTVTGADVIYTFNSASNSYTSAGTTATLSPGQAAWVYSAEGAMLTIS
jgi:hypothetical protein